MTKFRRPRAIALVLVQLLVAGAFIAFTATAAEAAPTGATATKDCPSAPVGDPYTIGDTVECTATFVNAGEFPATVTSLTETNPFVALGSPDNGPSTGITCTLPDGTTVIDVGDTLAAGVVCTAVFDVTIPDDPALCNTGFRDRVDVDLEYPDFDPPLTAGAFATHTLLVVCPPTITVTKVADELSKVGDPVSYTIEVCNTGLVPVDRESVIDSLIGDITDEFLATLAPGACDEVVLSRDVVEGDPDPLENTVTATYTAGLQTATAEASDTTNLFQPSVDVTKSCAPDPIQVGEDELCTIVVTNTSSDDTPDLVNGTIMDTLSGDLLDATNTAVVSSDCAATLPTGGSCTIMTTREVLASDVSPLVNTVTVHYNPGTFPNDITDSATDSVIIETPVVGACHETVNPAGNPAVGDNGFPDDPFGGDAVPGGKSTSPGTKGNGPINSDGFYLVSGNLFSDTTPIPFPGGGFVWPDNTTVKYTEWGKAEIKITSMAGPNSVITYQVQAPGDLYSGAPMGDPAAIFCGVPPPPF